MPSPGPERSRPSTPHARRVFAALAAVLVVGLIGTLVWIARSGGGEPASQPVTLGPSEVLLEPKDTLGPEPFDDGRSSTESGPASLPTTVPATTAPDATTSAPPSTADPTTIDPPSTNPPSTVAPAAGIESLVGSNPGLYGGTRNNRTCDREQMKAFLATNRDKATAWVGALNTDPTVQWSGGLPLTTSAIGAYIDELTPVVLTGDTRVTNHGFRNGGFTTRQVVLQAGTAVLVDRWGVPRARCLCGNPLTRPIPIAAPTTIYVGNPWPRFNPTTIVVIVPASQPIDTITIIDTRTGAIIIRPAGTDGSVDSTPAGGSPGQAPIPAPPTTAPPPTAGTITTSGPWTFTWSWTVTVVSFAGDVSYDAGRWAFVGQFADGGSATWRPGSGSAQCVLAADPTAALPAPGTMSCDVTFPEDSWTGETSGQITLITGELDSFRYDGSGTGTSSQGSSAITMQLTGPTTRTAPAATAPPVETVPPDTAPAGAPVLVGSTYCERLADFNRKGQAFAGQAASEELIAFVRAGLAELLPLAPPEVVADIQTIAEFFASVTLDEDVIFGAEEYGAAEARFTAHALDVCGVDLE